MESYLKREQSAHHNRPCWIGKYNYNLSCTPIDSLWWNPTWHSRHGPQQQPGGEQSAHHSRSCSVRKYKYNLSRSHLRLYFSGILHSQHGTRRRPGGEQSAHQSCPCSIGKFNCNLSCDPIDSLWWNLTSHSRHGPQRQPDRDQSAHHSHLGSIRKCKYDLSCSPLWFYLVESYIADMVLGGRQEKIRLPSLVTHVQVGSRKTTCPVHYTPLPLFDSL